MRCYFMRNGYIDRVVLLENVTDDSAAIKKGAELFIARLSLNFDGFEIWDRDRMVFRYPEPDTRGSGSSTNGNGNSKSTKTKDDKKDSRQHHGFSRGKLPGVVASV